MSERIAAVARGEHKRGIGFAVCAAALIAATVLFVSGLSGTSGATAAGRSAHRVGHGAGSLSSAQISANVNRLIGEMTVAEKFGQLEQAGPSTASGSDLIPLAEKGQIGSV